MSEAALAAMPRPVGGGEAGDVDEDGRADPASGTEVAVAALVVSVVWLFFLGSLLGVTLGVVAQRRLARERAAESVAGSSPAPAWADRAALAAIVIGAVELAFAGVIFVLMVAGVMNVTAACHPAVTGQACRLIIRRG